MTFLVKLLGFLSKFALAFEPPTADLNLGTEEGRRMLQWRTNIAVGITVLIYAFLVFSVWSLGFVPYFGGGFARADESRETRAELLAQKIQEVETVLCMEEVDAVLANYSRQLREEYRKLTGRDPDIPPCSVLLRLKR